MSTSATRKKGKNAEKAELQQKLISFLEGQRRLGGDSYPVTLRRLIELAGVPTSSTIVKEVINSKAFKDRVVNPAKQNLKPASLRLEAPVALVEDITMLADSEALLRYAFETGCTEKTRTFTVSGLGGFLAGSKDINKQFMQALKERIAARSFPAWMGFVLLRGKEYLFRMDDIVRSQFAEDERSAESASETVELQSEQPTPQKEVEAPQQAETTSSNGFEEDFHAAFDRLNREHGSKNFLKLRDLRRALSQYSREEFDRGLNQLRRAHIYSLDSSDGNHVSLTEEERQAGIMEGGSNLVYCSRR